MPQAETLTAATSLSNDLTVTGYSVPASDERAGRFLFQPHTDRIRVSNEPILKLHLFGTDAICERLEADLVIVEGIINVRAGGIGV